MFELNATTFDVKLKSLTFHFSSNSGCISFQDDHASLWRNLLDLLDINYQLLNSSNGLFCVMLETRDEKSVCICIQILSR